MPKTMIFYQSPHHGNTKKLLDAIVKAHPDVQLVKAGAETADLSQADLVGFASGIYAGRLHRGVRKALESADGAGRKAFLLYTCGDTEGEKYGGKYLETLREKGFEPCGFYWSLGHDSFGPLRLVGGIHKDRPNGEDIRGAVAFYESLTG